MWIRVALAGVILACTAAAQDMSALRPCAERLKKNLQENILSFWLSKSLDRVHGGYVIGFDSAGRPTPNPTKMIVTQARTVWLFSRAARAGYGGSEFLEAAGIGFRFLRDRMWDAKNGGFYWELDATGKRRLRPRKHLYGQAFALYALSEYYLAGRNPEALALANRLFRVLEAKAHDRRYGGYIEDFNEDWTAPPPDRESYMGQPARLKLMNTHLHLMEAMTTYYRASRLPLARERLLELIAIQSNAVVRKSVGACTDTYERDWRPLLDGPHARVSYGHDVENVWLLIEACKAAGVSCRPYSDLFRTLWEYTLQHGYDADAGGLYESGPLNAPADKRDKVWWVQAEAIVSALYMYRETGDRRYLDVFRKTYDFIDTRMVDWARGEWYESLTPEGTIQGGKAHAWKAGYHNGRAMIQCLELLTQP